MSAPSLSFYPNWRITYWPFMTFQPSPLFSQAVAGQVGTALWMVLLVMGAWAAVANHSHRRFAKVIVFVILAQLLLHLCYGRETFLYSLHYLPFLIFLVGLAALTPLRPAFRALAAGLVLCNLLNNVPTYLWAANYTQRLETLGQKRLRQPEDLDRNFELYALEAERKTVEKYRREMAGKGGTEGLGNTGLSQR